MVAAVHLDFIEAGARIVTVNTYTATPPRLEREGIAPLFNALHRAALNAAEAAREKSGQPVWTALSVNDADGSVLRSGEGVAEGARAAVDAGAEAVLINCSSPEAVATAMPLLAGIGVPFGGYANGFVSIAAMQPGGTVEALEARDDLSPATYADHAMGWVAAGAVIVGGCCEIGPGHIAALGQRLAAEGHDLSSAL